MSYASPTNNFDFESLFLEEEQEVPNFYQSPTESLLSTSSSGTDHTNSSNEQQQITYDVISDGYVFGANDFDQKPAQKGLKQDDLAAANPFFNQTTNNQMSSLNPLNNFLYNQNQKPGFMGYQNPQLMGQLGMYFPHTFPNVFPQFGNQPFPFPNNNLIYTSPNTSPTGVTTSPNSNNSNPTSNTLSNNTSPNNTTTQPTETKTKASRRKSAKKNTKSITSTTNSTPTPTSTTPTSTKISDENTNPSPVEQQSTKTTTPEPTDSDNSNQSSEKEENDSSSSSTGKKSEEKKRKRKSKKEGKESKALTPEEEKELKRQRRLIKNRESAQASRERKKIYIQGLEKKVDGLAQEFNDLQGHVLTLEEENELLRQRLKMLGEVVEEPSHKKRKMVPMTSSGQMKVPIPMDSRSFANPFMLDFWSLFGVQQQLQQAQQATPDLAQLNPRAASSSRRVVMFIMLFCVAMFLVLPHSSDIKFDSQTTTTTSPTEQTESVTSRLSPASRKLASTEPKETMVDVSIDASQKPYVDEDFRKNVAEIYQAFQQVRSEASESTSEETDKPIMDDLTSRINVVFDTDKVSLSFPKSILVKKEESDEMIDEKLSNATYDEKMALLSNQLLKEICRVVRD